MATKCVLNKSTLSGIADAIRTKGGTAGTMRPGEMAAKITAIPTGNPYWNKPDEWPDLHTVLAQYPAPSSAPYAIAYLVDNSLSAIMTQTPCNYFRVSDNPNSLQALPTDKYIRIDKTKSINSTHWIICYYADVSKANIGCGGGAGHNMNTAFLWCVAKGFRVAIAGSAFRFGVHLQCVEVDDADISGGYNFEYSGLRYFKARNVSVSAGTSAFSSCYALKAVDAVSLDASSATNFNNMFYYCTSLVSIPVIDAGSATTMSAMFQYCQNLEYLPIVNITNKITNAPSAFGYMNALRAFPDDIDLSGCSSGSSLSNTFYAQRSAIKHLPKRLKCGMSFGLLNGTAWYGDEFDKDSLATFDENGNIIDGLCYNINNVSGQTITIGGNVKGQYTTTQQNAIASMFAAKGWTISW